MYPVDFSEAFAIEPFGTTEGRDFPHSGDDFARLKNNAGLPIIASPRILACYAGTVIAAGRHAQAGLRTVIDYDELPIFGIYAHQASIGVREGERVEAGDDIGLMGATGKTSGIHLHYSQATDREKALSGVVAYWRKGMTVAQWAAASGLVRPNYHRPVKHRIPREDPLMAYRILREGNNAHFENAVGVTEVETAAHLKMLRDVDRAAGNTAPGEMVEVGPTQLRTVRDYHRKARSA